MQNTVFPTVINPNWGLITGGMLINRVQVSNKVDRFSIYFARKSVLPDTIYFELGFCLN
jgi:hypothetical protein